MDGWNHPSLSTARVSRRRDARARRSIRRRSEIAIRNRDPYANRREPTRTRYRFIHRSIRVSDSSSTDRASRGASRASFDAAIRDDARGVVARGVDVARRERRARRASRGASRRRARSGGCSGCRRRRRRARRRRATTATRDRASR